MAMFETTAVAASERLTAHLKSLGATRAGVGRTLGQVGGAIVPALIVFINDGEKALVGAMEEFEGYPLVWNVAYSLAA